ncbi:MAG: dTDP-glucose 4,6-dehydratase [Elusimicrobia bacterium]|nr:dTDP-glucose 4,6-dehydratase [Elusimicrobiota bacterium]
MRKRFSKLLITGGAGFIGSEFVRRAVREKYQTCVVDKLTYAGDLRRLKEVKGKYIFYKTDICSRKQIFKIFEKERPDAVIHFAAESHVDRSIKNATPFMRTNVIGTQMLLDASLKYGVKKFVHISTDEVYGEIKKGKFTENSAFRPNSPYSVSKAAADMLALAYFRTYGLPVVVARPSNNYGPWQYPEKLIPVAIKSVLAGKPVPVYAKGQNVREWLYVSDCCDAIFLILDKGKIGHAYNIGSGEERPNISTVKEILKLLKKGHDFIKFVKDRPGHDFRYSLDTRKIKKELNWKAKTKFSLGIKKTVFWYLKNIHWLKSF